MAALNLVYPNPASWKLIEADLVAKDRANRLGLQLFPVETEETHFVRWSQKDNQHGLMQMRGIDGAPPRVQRTGDTSFVYEPGVYGEHIMIGEREMLTRSVPGRPDVPIPVGDLVNQADTQLIQRLDDRMEYNTWTLLATGILNIPLPGPNGVTVYKDSYSFQTYTATVPWATASTATPIVDFQKVQQLHLGHGTDFGSSAKAYMNQFTLNLLLNNNNAADLQGRRSNIGATINDLGAVNNYFGGQNLPQIQVYDEGFQPLPLSGVITNAATQFQKWIPDHTVIVVGKRPGNAPLGRWKQTIQAMMPGGAPSAGEYRFIKDYARGVNAPVEVPPKIEVHRGFSGGLVIEYPTGVVTMTV